VNTNKKEEIIKIEDDTNITIFINILFMGRTGGFGSMKASSFLLDFNNL
jgi:hypothetical protein